MGYLLAVFGEAGLNKNLIFDTLSDHFRFGPADAEGYFEVTDKTRWEDVELVIALDTPAGAEALAPLNEWCARAGITYTLLTRSGLKAPGLAADAARVQSATDVPAKLASMLLASEAQEQDSAALVLVYEPGFPDEACKRLYALTEGAVPTYSLSEGLLPVDAADLLPEQQPDSEPEPEPEAESVPVEVFTIKGEVVAKDFEFADPAIPGLLDMLGFLDAVDKACEEMLAAALAGYGRVQQLVSGMRGALPMPPVEDGEQPRIAGRDEIPQDDPVIEPQEAPKPVKVKREWKDPETGEWKPVGRGRPRKNVEIREVAA